MYRVHQTRARCIHDSGGRTRDVSVVLAKIFRVGLKIYFNNPRLVSFDFE
jgi:hypothetical protein